MTTLRGTMDCPKCQTELMTETIEKVEVDRCPTCGGLWLDKGELDRLVDPNAKMVEFTSLDYDPLRHADQHPQRGCPRCQQMMKKVDLMDEQTGVIYDYCSNCQGFWLDQDEIVRTKQYLEKHGNVEQPMSFLDFYHYLLMPLRDRLTIRSGGGINVRGV